MKHHRLVRMFKRWRDWPLLLEAAFWLGVAALMLAWMPFRDVTRHLHPRLSPPPRRLIDPARLAWAVTAAGRRVPWRNACFHQGIAVQRMLARRAIAGDLCYGVHRGLSPTELKAHVWVTVRDRVVIGDLPGEECTLLHRFKPRPGPAGGASASGTSAGGTSAGGTSAGGTSAGGTSE